MCKSQALKQFQKKRVDYSILAYLLPVLFFFKNYFLCYVFFPPLFYSYSHQSEKTDAVTVTCVQYIDVTDECLPVCVCVGGGGGQRGGGLTNI